MLSMLLKDPLSCRRVLSTNPGPPSDYSSPTISPLFSLAAPALLKDQSALSPLDAPDKKSSEAAVVGTSLPLPVPNKPESVVSITSQCSYSSTIVHVGDKKPQPDSGTLWWSKSRFLLSFIQLIKLQPLGSWAAGV